VDGSFYVVDADHGFAVGTEVFLDGTPFEVLRRAGTDARPLIRVSEEAPPPGTPIFLDEPLQEGEFLAADLVGCEVPGLGTVARVVNGPSCDVLELSPGGELVPMVSEAVREVDLEGRRITVDLAFLGVDRRI
jgi:hypothetical protein